MPDNTYGFVYDQYGNTRKIKVYARGAGVLASNYTNKGTSFTTKERRKLRLEGLVPPAVRSLQSQIANSFRVVNDKQSDIEKFIYIRSLFDRNVTLAHALIASDIERFMPIIYTPTVGLACQHYSSMFRRANGIYFYPDNIDQAEDILELYGHRDIRVAVVTDNQGVLGIGDQGVGGIAICLGKLMLYTQGAGIAPWHCLPVSLDVGTDNQELLNDPNYLGWRHARLRGEEYVRFVQRFAKAFRSVYPNALCQWEDFSKQNAFAIRDAYLHDLISFNDDIQGTGAVTLAAIISAVKVQKSTLKDQVYLIHGAGAGGIGIADQIKTALQEEGLSEQESVGRIYALDSKGLMTTDRQLEPYKQKFAKDSRQLPWFTSSGDGTLEKVVAKARVSVLIGTSGQAGCFTKEVIKSMLRNAERPVVLPLSNPTTKIEAQPKDIFKWTKGRALVATGSPFPSVTATNGRKLRIGQCNNVFIFPGIGLGVLSSGAREVLPAFFTAAARAVSDMVPAADLKKGVLMPPVTALRKVSLEVAFKVGMRAIERGCGLCVYSGFQHDNDPERLRILIDKMRWKPKYLPLEPM